jgi:hypothetical protein
MAAKIEEIGLLLVHGIGEQKRLEHLRQTAKDLESAVASKPGVVRLAVQDNSAASAPQDPSITIDATIQDGKAPRRVRLHLHEVWWADLGFVGGFFSQFRFWIWGLGQWGAEVVTAGSARSNTSTQMVNPGVPDRGFDSRPVSRLPQHLLLFVAAMLALVTFFTWYWAKRLVGFFKNRLPNPDLITLYLGDVMVYQAAGGPGRGTIEDPDMPVRTTIRRRMVRGMTTMARNKYDRWYILAHSLGTIPAFNMLQELEVTLPNYLTQQEWKDLPANLKTKDPFEAGETRASRDHMMPMRPPWLTDADGISRLALFERFAGLVTYGSPLDKFAAMWPRIVPLNRQTRAFQEKCEWLNLYDPMDPVGARLDSFAAPGPDPNEPKSDRKALAPDNVACRALCVFLLSHIYYLTPWRARKKAMVAAITDALVSNGELSLKESAGNLAINPVLMWLRYGFRALQVGLLVLILFAAASYLLALIQHLLLCTKGVCTGGIDSSIENLKSNAWIVFWIDLTVVGFVGLIRAVLSWRRSWLDERKKREGKASA